MRKRKYMSEFGLNVFTSYKSIVALENLELFRDNRNYHIYSILSSPKVIFVKDSFKVTKTHISFDLEKRMKTSSEKFKVKKVILSKYLDHSKVNLKCEYPYNNLEIQISDISGDSSKLKRLLLSAHEALSMFVSNIICEFEVLYVGQAFGKNGERVATDRLKSHSTLQKILTDYYSSYPDKQLHVFLFEFTPRIHGSFDGVTKIYTATDEEEKRHFDDVINNPLKYKQIINITEAAMINYFKPPYNINFVDNFPDSEHKGYNQYYDLDYNSLVVEIDLDFDIVGRVQLFSETNRIDSSFDYIEYELFNDPNRKNMFDIFVNDER